MADVRKRDNRHDVNWRYAGECWRAIKAGLAVPPIPNFQTFEVAENIGIEKLIKQTSIVPMKLICNGKVYFGG